MFRHTNPEKRHGNMWGADFFYGTPYQAFGGGPQILLPRLFVFDSSGRATAAFGRYFGNRTLREVDRAVERVLGPI